MNISNNKNMHIFSDFFIDMTWKDFTSPFPVLLKYQIVSKGTISKELLSIEKN